MSRVDGISIMINDKYNGWTNYATWRINLECFDCPEMYAGMTPGDLQKYIGDTLKQDCNNEFTLQLAAAFVEDVNFVEIHTAINGRD
jgi:hypothetical protein